MKSKIIAAIALLLTGVLPLSAQMIAEIAAPVETEFGAYIPYPVAITPAAGVYTVAADLSNVVNVEDFSFESTERSLLARQHFFVTPKRSGNHTGYREMYDLYNEARELGIPIFVTSDAILHSFHLIFDHMLMEIEEEHFAGDLDRLLSGLLDIVMNQHHPQASDDSTRAALQQTMHYLIVAKSLIDSTYDPHINGGDYIPELALIREHAQTEASPIFDYEEDYTQYIVRGHYTRSALLGRYFRAMMWLGRMTFAADPSPAHEHLNRRATLAALILMQALERLTLDGEPALAVWERIYAPTVFFVGKSDDTTPAAYRELIAQIYGSEFVNLDISQLSLVPRFDQFLALAKQLPGPLIRYPGQPQGFRLMGQRFIPDSYVLDQLVYNNVPGRFMPKGLDVMAVLGSERACSHLEALGEMNNSAYKQRLDELRAEFKAYPAATWAQNLYWNWLYSLMPLLYPKGEGYPPFMQNEAWLDKELQAALGSWAELRHHTILSAKQSGTERGLPQMNLLRQGYVEPNPHFYGRMAALGQFLMTGLEQRGLLKAKFRRHLGNFTALALELKGIAEKELLDQPLSYEEYNAILGIGLALENLAEFSDEPSMEGPSRFSDEAMPVIADVHSDFNAMTCLEEGVGYPYTVYVICRIEGELVVARGAGFSYYEFEHPMADRLTDEAWRTMLHKGAEPPPPAWTQSFLHGGWVNANPDYYYLQKMGVSSLIVRLAAAQLQAGDAQSVTIGSTGEPFADAPVVMLIDPQGFQTGVAGVTAGASGYQLLFPTEGLAAGRYHLEVQAKLKHGDRIVPLSYRTGFDISTATAVDCPQAQVLPAAPGVLQNYPNPFNPSTVIRYTLASAVDIHLSVSNARGQEVAVLRHGRESEGEHAVSWNGVDDRGLPVPSGLYFAVLQAGPRRQVCKLLLLQ